MKLYRFSLLVAMNFFLIKSFGQIQIKTFKGSQLLNPFILDGKQKALLNLNTGDASLGFDYLISTKGKKSTSKFEIYRIGLIAKPNEGFAPVISNGQFSPGINFGFSAMKMGLFCSDDPDKQVKFQDWGSVNIGSSIDQYQMFKSDTAFDKQLFKQSYTGFNLSVDYNILLSANSLITARLGYLRNNNISELIQKEIKDIQIITQPGSTVTREVSRTRKAYDGKFNEFDTYPLSLTFTRIPRSEPEKIPDNHETNKLVANPKYSNYKVGYAFYITSLVSKNLPVVNIGSNIFLCKPADKGGLQKPQLGLIIEFSDFPDVKRLNNGLIKRMNLGFNINFPL